MIALKVIIALIATTALFGILFGTAKLIDVVIDSIEKKIGKEIDLTAAAMAFFCFVLVFCVIYVTLFYA